MYPEGVLTLLNKPCLPSLFLSCPVTSTAVQTAVVLDIECPLFVGRAEGRVLLGRTRITKEFQKRCAYEIRTVIPQSNTFQCQVRRQYFSLLLCQVGLNNGHQIEQVIAQRELASVCSTLCIVPSVKAFFNANRIIGGGWRPASSACCCKFWPSA